MTWKIHFESPKLVLFDNLSPDGDSKFRNFIWLQLIHGQKTCFLGPIQLVTQKLNNHYGQNVILHICYTMKPSSYQKSHMIILFGIFLKTTKQRQKVTGTVMIWQEMSGIVRNLWQKPKFFVGKRSSYSFRWTRDSQCQYSAYSLAKNTPNVS